MPFMPRPSAKQIKGGSGNIPGTSSDDDIYGSSSIDIIDGLAGDDIIFGYGGVDIIKGGEGNDIIYGGNGDEDGNLDGGGDPPSSSATEQLEGGAGNDTIYGEEGDDVLKGGELGSMYNPNDPDRDQLYGGDGNDSLLGGYGNDTLVGGAGDDKLLGSTEKRGRHAYDGIDKLTGDGSSGSPGADTFILGEDGVRYYDDNNDSTDGSAQYALITDFNPSQGDKIQLAKLPPQPSPILTPQGQPVPGSSIPARYLVTPATFITGYTGSGVAIVYQPGSGANPTVGRPSELIAIVDNLTNVSSLNLTAGYIVYS